MSNELPRIIGVRTDAEPFKVHITVKGASELARMVRLPKGLPDVVVGLQFLADFNGGKLRPAPVLFSATLRNDRE